MQDEPVSATATTATKATTMAPQQAVTRDGEPALERQAELRKAYEENIAAGRLPYGSVQFCTRGEVEWAMRERGWSGQYLASDPNDKEADADTDASTAAARKERAAGFSYSIFSNADLRGIHLSQMNLRHARFDHADVSGAQLIEADLSGANLNSATLAGTYFTEANLSGTKLHTADLSGANLFYANLRGVQLDGANLAGADLEGADLSGANMTHARMDATTVLAELKLDRNTRLADVVWNGASLTRIPWDQVPVIGEESLIRQFDASLARHRRYTNAAAHGGTGAPPSSAVGATYRLTDQETGLGFTSRDTAARVYRQLAAVLRTQGLSEHADHYAYRAHLLQRKAFWKQEVPYQGRRRAPLYNFGRYLGSLYLDLLSGYGYRPLRACLTYVGVVGVFAGIYALLAYFHLSALRFTSWDSPLVLSVTSFHGRVLFGGGLALTDWAARVGAIEAILGLLIEITLIATFTQRLFAR